MSIREILLNKWYDAVTGQLVTDMSAPGKSVTEWFYASEIGGLISMTPEWTGTGNPVGVFVPEQTNDRQAVVTSKASAVDLANYYSSDSPEPNPSGDGLDGSKPVLIPQPGLKIRWAYMRTSGGVGATCVVRCTDGREE